MAAPPKPTDDDGTEGPTGDGALQAAIAAAHSVKTAAANCPLRALKNEGGMIKSSFLKRTHKSECLLYEQCDGQKGS